MGYMMPNIKYEYPARLEGNPTSQYNIRKKNEEPLMLRGSSPRICAATRAVQLYIRLGFSRISKIRLVLMKGPCICLDRGELMTRLMNIACLHIVNSNRRDLAIRTYEDLILSTLDRILRLEEREPNKKRSDDVQRKLR